MREPPAAVRRTADGCSRDEEGDQQKTIQTLRFFRAWADSRVIVPPSTFATESSILNVKIVVLGGHVKIRSPCVIFINVPVVNYENSLH